MFKVIIAGGRSFNNYSLLCMKVDSLLRNKKDIEIVSGVATGADLLGYKYAEERGYKIEAFPAKWGIHGKRAGMLRNIEMGDYADALIAFWNGTSHGTKHMIEYMQSLGKPVRVIRYVD